MSSSRTLRVTDSQASWAGTMRLVADSSGTVTLMSEHGSESLQQWQSPTDTPRFERQSDGLSIRIGMKRFIIATDESQSAIDAWLACAAGNDGPEVEEDTASLAERVQKYTEMLNNGLIDAEEFAALVQKASGGSQAETAAREQEREDLEERMNLSEYQRLWLATFDGGMPLTLDPVHLMSRVNQIRRELASLSSDATALTTLTAKMFDLKFLAMGQIGNEISRAIKKGKPLPDLAQRAISSARSEMNAGLRPLREFARRMGWSDVPVL